MLGAFYEQLAVVLGRRIGFRALRIVSTTIKRPRSTSAVLLSVCVYRTVDFFSCRIAERRRSASFLDLSPEETSLVGCCDW